jgi:tetratricopeptide (TPR) repeat protein/predicted Ser/Thr protein kinase
MMSSGTLIAGRFEIEREAGAGGMGVVYRAHDRATGEPVAVKLARSARDAERFEREGEVLSRLAHPAIVRHVAHGTDEGHAYIAMEWLEGVDLAERLERSGLTFAESIRLAAGAAGALAHAHARGVVHRDIKPSNLFLRGGDVDQVAVLDFGVARVAGASRAMTGSGAVLGTPGYMAPEQARGERTIDARADVFALGCVLFECLTGRPAFVGEHVMALLAKILFEDAPRARDVRAEVPPALDALVARMVAKDPAMRLRDGAAALAELAALDLSNDPARAPRVAPASAITGGEQRLISIVMALGAAGTRDDAPTLTPATAEQADAELDLAIASHGGRLERLADGTLVALLAGAGTAADQAASAARSALAMRGLLGDVAIAVVTGRADLAGRLPIGEAVDRAARLLRRDAPGSGGLRPIHLDEMTRGLLDARFRIEGAGGAGDGGLSLLGEVEAQDGARKLLGVATRCFGRERDLALLTGIFDECATDRMARAVVVTAPAGTGKSRLCHELLGRLRHDGGVAVWVARGATISAGSAFGMLRQLVKRATGVLDAEPRGAWAAKLRAHVAARAPASEAGRVVEFLSELIGAGEPDGAGVSALLRSAREDPTLMGDQLRRAFVDLVGGECETRPLVIVLEDLHWGDLPTVKAIDAALRSLRDRPLLVLALARPEVYEVFPRLWGERDAHMIRLGGLPRRAAEALAVEVLGEAASAATVARIVERAGGNAFYLEELIRAVAEGRGDALPETVVAMMQTRLEGLEPELRRVLRAASVYGEVFWTGGVSALLGADAAPGLRERLAELTHRELVAPRREGRFGGEDEHVFRHAIVREAAYAMLTDRDRATGHRLAGAWLEAAGEREAMVLAEHFERGGEGARAVPWFLRAAESALEGGDLAAAISRAESGVVSGAEGETLGLLRAIQSEAYGFQGHFPQVLGAATEVIALVPAGSPTWNGVVGAVLLANLYMGRIEELDAHIDLLERQGAEGGRTRIGALGRAVAVQSLIFTGRYARARTLLEGLEAMERAGLAPEPAALGWSRWGRLLGALLIDADMGEALELVEGSSASFGEASDPLGLLLAMAFQGWCLMVLGDFERAERVLDAAVTMSRRLGVAFAELLSKLFLAAAVAHRGEVLSALTLLAEVQQSCAATGNRLVEGLAQRSLAQGWLLAGDLEGALVRAESAVELTRGAPPFHAEALATLAQVRAQRGEQAEVLAAARRAMAIVDDLGGVGPMEAGVRLVHVQALQAAGDDEGARAALAKARDLLATRAERILDPGLRRSFLEGNRTHRKTLAMARKWLGEGPDR